MRKSRNIQLRPRCCPRSMENYCCGGSEALINVGHQCVNLSNDEVEVEENLDFGNEVEDFMCFIDEMFETSQLLEESSDTSGM
ncbi:hypothetical protein JTB14_009841 [Gonioctena quinquepunctata]|nr:hypothetical protein JTB14_009841 [Gonioctena quinquepunctata]